MLDDRYQILRESTNVFCSKLPLIINHIIECKDSYTDKIIVKIKVKNIGAKKINSVKILLQTLNNKMEIKEEIEFSCFDLELKTNSEKIIEKNLEFNEININAGFNLIIKSLEFDNKIINSDIILNKIEQNNSLNILGNLEEQYEREVNSIVRKPIIIYNTYEDFGEIWQCTCGNYYYEDIYICPRCNLSRNDLKRVTDENYLIEKQKEYEKRQDEKVERTIKNVKNVGSKGLKIFLIILVSIILGVVIFLIGRDYLIKNMLKENDIGKAIRIDSNVLVDYEDYIYKLIEKYDSENNIDYEIELLKNIHEYDFSNKFYEEIIEAQYKYILKEYENQNYEKAYLYLDNVIENEKNKNNTELLEKAKVIRYYKALDYINNAEYENAKQLLENIEYEDSKSKLDIANYYIAKNYLNNKLYKKAKELFEQMSAPYEDSDELLKEAKYNYAIERYEKYKTNNSYSLSELENIKNEFCNVSNYKDSNNYISDIDEALKWHGTWHNILYSEESHYSDVKFNYFTSKLTLPNNIIFTGKGNNEITFIKDGNKYVYHGTFGDEILYKDGEQLVKVSDDGYKNRYNRE